ncbi:MAG: efflux RND transporter permease subunit [Armatimonadota bacterium]|nr:efflux RND transporter permease subunit [Armatimonadota bacterium]MDR7542027.1 efflux RND transporter permease subunit [Armatimonadota bacterium]MDR7577744.1 efflux RND transporter permease subunit [Armatimonadota bacterium]MDR7579806.1 efflux RND transporter permease subunit [Armatimonadota bacterium]MDR7594453.1 efflux RND transporter permease subunit [Armatimonadota bacterium]
MSPYRLSLARPIGTCIVFSAVVLVGLASLAGLPIDLLPDITLPRLTVVTDYPGAGPEEVENLVSRVVEEAVSTVPGVRDVVSVSSLGTSRVTATFTFGRDLDAAAADLRSAVERVRRRLPEDATQPVVFKFDPSQMPILQIGLVAAPGSRVDLARLVRLAEEQVLFRIERVPGVAVVELRGGTREEIRVEADRSRLQALRLSDRDLVRALASSNLSAPVGLVTEGPRSLTVRLVSRFDNLDQIRSTVVAVRGGRAVRVQDVATVRRTVADPTGLVRVNGQPGILLQVQRQPGVNTVAVSDGVRREVERLDAQLADVRFLVVGDSAQFIRSAIRSVQQSLLAGAVLAVAVLWLFLKDVRSVLVVAVTIPISLLAAFALMYFAGYTLNLMTLGALALGVGMLVDTAIVVLENVFRHRERGAAGKEAALLGVRQVAGAVTASTLTTVVVFLPVIFLRSGAVVTQMFVQFSFVVVFALLCALAVSLTLTPVLASWLPALRSSESTRWMEPVVAGYRSLLQAALRRRWAVFGLAGAAALMTVGLVPLVGSELIPQTDEGEVFVNVRLPAATSLDVADRVLQGLEATARRVAPEVRDVTILSGTASFGSWSGILRVRLAPRSERRRSTEEVAAVLRRSLVVPGGRVVVRPSAGALNILRFGTGQDPISVEVRGFDLRQGMRVAEQVRTLLETVPGVTDATIQREEQAPELAVRVDPESAARFGLTPARVAEALQAAVAGEAATLVREGGTEVQVVVRLPEAHRRLAQDVLEVPIITPDGRAVLLKQVATLVRDLGPAQIYRRGRERVITVTAGLTGRDFGSVAEEVRQRLARMTLPPGFAVALSDEYEEQQRANRQLAAGFGLAVLLVYAVMAVQFERLLEPLLIMISVPFALTGSFLLLFLTGTTLNVQSFIGLIVLAGVVVNNAIVLLDFILQLHRDEGRPLYEAVEEAARTRLRPVLMTTLTTVLALVPTALGVGEGAELQAPLARSVIGGMVFSTLVTLVLIPTLYVAVEEVRQRRRAPQPVTRPAVVAGASQEAGGTPPA